MTKDRRRKADIRDQQAVTGTSYMQARREVTKINASAGDMVPSGECANCNHQHLCKVQPDSRLLCFFCETGALGGCPGKEEVKDERNDLADL
jgi:hypothetical protein